MPVEICRGWPPARFARRYGDAAMTGWGVARILSRTLVGKARRWKYHHDVPSLENKLDLLEDRTVV